MANRIALALLASLGFLAAACGGDGRANSQRAEAVRTVRTRTQVIQPSAVFDLFQAPGTIKAKTATVVSSKIVGQILSLTVREGDRVRQGQVLAEIDNREAAAQLRRAQAGLVEAQRSSDETDRGVEAADAALRSAEANRDLASSTRKRYDLLRERRSISAQEYDEIDTKYKAAQSEAERARQGLAAAETRRLQISARIEQAEAEVQGAEVALGYSKLVSPINGLVSSRHAEPGMLATPGLPMLAIEDDRTYELEAAVEESRVAQIRIGQSARIEVDALQGMTIEGIVREIIPSSDPATRTYTVKLQFKTVLPSDRVVRSGFFGRAFFPAGERQALVIPESAVVRRGQLEGVYIVENGAALLRLVKTGKHYDDRVEIISGLSAGSRIVPVPTSGISDGVKIVDDDASRKTP
jgi:multidrug efflux pump subunit AcrA (membrane-fusion protein)